MQYTKLVVASSLALALSVSLSGCYIFTGDWTPHSKRTHPIAQATFSPSELSTITMDALRGAGCALDENMSAAANWQLDPLNTGVAPFAMTYTPKLNDVDVRLWITPPATMLPGLLSPTATPEPGSTSEASSTPDPAVSESPAPVELATIAFPDDANPQLNDILYGLGCRGFTHEPTAVGGTGTGDEGASLVG